MDLIIKMLMQALLVEAVVAMEAAVVVGEAVAAAAVEVAVVAVVGEIRECGL